MYKEVPSKIKMLNLSPTSNTCPETVHGFNPTKPWHDRVNEKEVTGDPKGSEELADKYEDEIDSWLSLNPDNEDDENNSTNGYSCFENQYQVHHNSLGSTESESLVPLPFAVTASEQLQEQWHNFYLGMEYEMSKDGLVHDPLWSQSVSVPCMDADISPVATMSSTISESYRRNPEVALGKASSTTIPMQQDFSVMNREAKVQRYREKRKARKYEKKIRYASRQAYAESRPRVKGKFARETDKEIDINPVFSIMDKYSHGIGPSPSFCPTHKT